MGIAEGTVFRRVCDEFMDDERERREGVGLDRRFIAALFDTLRSHPGPSDLLRLLLAMRAMIALARRPWARILAG